jgi:hypothetical protein
MVDWFEKEAKGWGFGGRVSGFVERVGEKARERELVLCFGGTVRRERKRPAW